MNPSDYTPQERIDIEERVEKAKKALEELQLQPGVAMQAINMGNDVFGFKPIAFLQDIKFKPIISPLQKEDLGNAASAA